MGKTYPVYFGAEAVGAVEVEVQGLYYVFTCRCRMLESAMYYLNICWDGGAERLGLLAPEGERLCLNAKIPAKRVGQGDLRFALAPKHEKLEGHFVPVFPEEPFAWLRQLEGAYLANRQGQMGIVLNTKKM